MSTNTIWIAGYGSLFLWVYPNQTSLEPVIRMSPVKMTVGSK